MSTDYVLHKDGEKEVSMTERSARYDLDMFGYPQPQDEHDDVYGPQQMSADAALTVAAGIIYAVWCSYQDKADEAVAAMAVDIPRGLDFLRERTPEIT